VSQWGGLGHWSHPFGHALAWPGEEIGPGGHGLEHAVRNSWGARHYRAWHHPHYGQLTGFPYYSPSVWMPFGDPWGADYATQQVLAAATSPVPVTAAPMLDPAVWQQIMGLTMAVGQPVPPLMAALATPAAVPPVPAALPPATPDCDPGWSYDPSVSACMPPAPPAAPVAHNCDPGWSYDESVSACMPVKGSGNGKVKTGFGGRFGGKRRASVWG